MLFVHFQLGPHRYALDARSVVEVLPLLELKPVAQAPRGLAAYSGVAAQELGAHQSATRLYAGLFLYRGQPVPALDLCALTLDRPAREHLSTRILIVQHTKTAGRVGELTSSRGEPCPPRGGRPGLYAAGGSQLIGLIAERVAGTLQREEKDFVNVGVEMVAAPFLGPILMDAQGIIQILDAQKLLDAGGHPLQLTCAPEASDAPH